MQAVSTARIVLVGRLLCCPVWLKEQFSRRQFGPGLNQADPRLAPNEAATSYFEAITCLWHVVFGVSLNMCLNQNDAFGHILYDLLHQNVGRAAPLNGFFGRIAPCVE